MAYTHYERLTAVDAAMLGIESDNIHFHVGAVGIFDTGPLRRPDGGLDHERAQRAVEAALHTSPRLRQKLAWTPVTGNPVWVDDARFNLHYHVRHTALASPGGIRELKRLAGRLMSQKLDRGKPLWELWLVEGLEDDRFALIVKAHHCMVDGIAGIGLLAGIMRGDESRDLPPARAWHPRPGPPSWQLFRDELLHRARAPYAVLQAAGRAVRSPGSSFEAARETAAGVVETLGAGLQGTSPTPLNPEVGPHRRFDWTRIDLEAVKEVRRRMGGTINDVVLACVAGAMGRFLERRGLRPDELAFRSMVPVSIRSRSEQGALGNRVTFMVADLAIGEKDPRRRLAATVKMTSRLKGSRQVAGMDWIEQVSDGLMPSLFELFAVQGARSRAYNMAVTNVPGPPFPLYFQGAPLRAIYPVVPVFSHQALSIGLFSYHGGLYWGFCCDWDALPDLHEFVSDVELEFERLHKAAFEEGDAPVGAPPGV